jgi:hypothetical protein
MTPSSNLWSTSVQVLAPAALTEVETILHEKTMAVSCAVGTAFMATSTGNIPSISSVGTLVPEEHACVTTVFEHLEPHKAPMMKVKSSSLTVSPTMQTIVVDSVPVVNPQFAAIIRNNAESVMASPEESHASSPTHSKMIMSGKARPPASGVPVVHGMTPTSHLWPAPMQILTSTTLTEVEGILPEETMAIGGPMRAAST